MNCEPWHIDRRPFRFSGRFYISNGRYIVATALGEMPSCEIEAAANARLIAAAPETAAERDKLLVQRDALLAALNELAVNCESASDQPFIAYVQRTARAAIAAVRGARA